MVGLPAAAQTVARLPRVGYLSMAPGPSARSDALQQGLSDLGYIAGHTIAIDYRWADGSLDRLREAALALVNAPVDVIVTGGPAATAAARQATATIPIVMAVDYDPVGAGFVSSLGHPGGNITGLSVLNPKLSGKRLELLKEAVPALTLVAVLWNPAEPNAAASLQQARLTAPALALSVQALEIRTPVDIAKAVAAAQAAGAGGVSVLTDPVTLYHRAELASLLLAQRLPAPSDCSSSRAA